MMIMIIDDDYDDNGDGGSKWWWWWFNGNDDDYCYGVCVVDDHEDEGCEHVSSVLSSINCLQ